MTEDDPLDGYRTPDMPDLSDAESALLRSLHDNRGILEIINAGLDMERFRATAAGKTVWKKAEETLAESIRTWLTTSDPTTPEVRNAHFNAAVAIQVLKSFQDAIDTGREMAQQLRQQSDEDQTASAD